MWEWRRGLLHAAKVEKGSAAAVAESSELLAEDELLLRAVGE